MSLFLSKKRKQPETESSKTHQASITNYFFGSPNVFPRVPNPPTQEERAAWEEENIERSKIQQAKVLKAKKKKNVLLEQSTRYNINYKPWPVCGGKLGIKERYHILYSHNLILSHFFRTLIEFLFALDTTIWCWMFWIGFMIGPNSAISISCLVSSPLYPQILMPTRCHCRPDANQKVLMSIQNEFNLRWISCLCICAKMVSTTQLSLSSNVIISLLFR